MIFVLFYYLFIFNYSIILGVHLRYFGPFIIFQIVKSQLTCQTIFLFSHIILEIKIFFFFNFIFSFVQSTLSFFIIIILCFLISKSQLKQMNVSSSFPFFYQLIHSIMRGQIEYKSYYSIYDLMLSK